MNLQPFADTDEFLTKFDLNTPPPYQNVTKLKDRIVGFSVTRNYPPDIRFVRAKRPNGEDDTVVLIHVSYPHPDESEKPVDLKAVPIAFSATSHSLYLRKRRDFGLTEDSPTAESLRASRASWRPIPLEFMGEYVFDHSSDSFRDSKGAALTGREVIDQVYKKHCDTVHPLRGFKIQTTLKSRNVLVNLASFTVSSLLSILRTIFGRTIDEKPDRIAYLQGYRKEDIRLLSPEKLTLLGYDASGNVIILFAILVTIVASGRAFLKVSGDLLDRLLSNNLFVVCFGITCLWFLDRVLPNILIWVLNRLIAARAWLLSLHFRA